MQHIVDQNTNAGTWTSYFQCLLCQTSSRVIEFKAKKNCGFSKSKFKLMQLERTEIRQERTSYP